MKKSNYIFRFKGGDIEIWAMDEAEGKILAQAEAIKNCWDYTTCQRVSGM